MQPSRIIIIAIILAVSIATGFAAIVGNFNDDCIVNQQDFGLFAAHYGAHWDPCSLYRSDNWDGDYDLVDTPTDANDIDLADLTAWIGNWLDYEEGYDGSPRISDQSITASAGDWVLITLAATDADALTWQVTGKPQYGTLYDVNGALEDPLGGSWYDPNNPSNPHTWMVSISSVPYNLGSKTQLYLHADDLYGEFITQVAVSDSIAAPCGGSNSASVIVTTDTRPTAQSFAINTYTHVGTPIVMQGADIVPGPAELTYWVLTNPTNAEIIDPESGPLYYTPWDLSFARDWVVFGTQTAGTYTLDYRVSDSAEQSSTATVTITAAANPQDCLWLEGGSLSLPDNGDDFDLVSAGCSISAYFRTSERDITLLKKRASGAGYELKLENHQPTLYIYNPDGSLAGRFDYSPTTGATDWDRGQQVDEWWCRVGFDFKADGSGDTADIDIWIGFFDEDGESVYVQSNTIWNPNLPDVDYRNSEPLEIFAGGYGGLDGLCYYTPIVPTSVSAAMIPSQIRSEAGDAGAISLPPAASICFSCEGTNYLKDASATRTLQTTGTVNRVPSEMYYLDSSRFRRRD